MAKALFFRQLQALFAGGVPLVKAFEILAAQADHPRLREAAEQASGCLLQGHSLSQSLGRFPNLFDASSLACVQIGEATGRLACTLENLAGQLQHEEQTWMRLRAALMYPLLVLGCAGLLGLLAVGVILPTVLELFEPKSGILAGLVVLSQAVRNPLIWALLLAVSGEFGLQIRRSWQNPQARLLWFLRLRSLPGLGKLLVSQALARHCASLSSMLISGLPLVKAWSLAAASASPEISADTERVLACLREGGSLTEAIQFCQIYPDDFTQLCRAGEESGRLHEMMRRLSTLYSLDVEVRLARLLALVEPLLLAGVSLALGGVLVALFIPLSEQLSRLSQ